MKNGRFTEEEVIGVLEEAEGRPKVSDLCRQHGTSEATFFR